MAVPNFPKSVLRWTTSKATTVPRAIAIVIICSQVRAAPKMLTSLPFSNCGNDSDDVPQINAAADSKMIATPSVLTSQAKLETIEAQDRADRQEIDNDATDGRRQ